MSEKRKMITYLYHVERDLPDILSLAAGLRADIDSHLFTGRPRV